jgi:hypothetical protein
VAVAPVRVGLLSTAPINAEILAAAGESELAEVVAVASRDAVRAEVYASDHGIARAYGDYRALLDDPDVEAVYVSVPNALHAEWSIRALEAGKHVLCEKPFSRHPNEVERAFDAAARAGRWLTEGLVSRHHPQTDRLVELVEGGAVGELRTLSAAFGFSLADPDNTRLRPELGGGALMDARQSAARGSPCSTAPTLSDRHARWMRCCARQKRGDRSARRPSMRGTFRCPTSQHLVGGSRGGGAAWGVFSTRLHEDPRNGLVEPHRPRSSMDRAAVSYTALRHPSRRGFGAARASKSCSCSSS